MSSLILLSSVIACRFAAPEPPAPSARSTALARFEESSTAQFKVWATGLPVEYWGRGRRKTFGRVELWVFLEREGETVTIDSRFGNMRFHMAGDSATYSNGGVVSPLSEETAQFTAIAVRHLFEGFSGCESTQLVEPPAGTFSSVLTEMVEWTSVSCPDFGERITSPMFVGVSSKDSQAGPGPHQVLLEYDGAPVTFDFSKVGFDTGFPPSVGGSVPPMEKQPPILPEHGMNIRY